MLKPFSWQGAYIIIKIVFQVNGKLITSDGSYLPNLERPEQIFEFLEHACNSAGIDFEQDIDLVLDIGASYFYEEVRNLH